jgi:hypothetical protein
MAMWAKCRQRRPPFLSILLNRVPSSGSAVQKSSTLAVVFGQQVWMFHQPFHFVRDAQELKNQLFPSSSRRVRTAAALAV